MSNLTINGFHRPTYEEILDEKIKKAQQLFGEDIDTTEHTALGKFIRIGAYDLSKAYEDLEAVYYARFPNTASGVSLDRLCVFAGISRNAATQAQHKIRVYSTEATETEKEIGIGELIVCGENNDIVFYSANTYILPPNGGNVEIIVECAESGNIGNVSTITEIVEPIAEIDRIEYVGIEEKGEETESDYDLRKRFVLAIEGTGSGNANAIRAALLRVPTVTSVAIIADEENHSFKCYVQGGEDYEQQIAETLFDKTPIGIKTQGNISITVTDDGGNNHIINFSHTENVTVYVKITYEKNANFETDGQEQIRKAVAEYINGLGVGGKVVLSALYSYIHNISGITDVSSLLIGTNANSLTASNIDINSYQNAQTYTGEYETGKYYIELVEVT